MAFAHCAELQALGVTSIMQRQQVGYYADLVQLVFPKASTRPMLTNDHVEQVALVDDASLADDGELLALDDGQVDEPDNALEEEGFAFAYTLPLIIT